MSDDVRLPGGHLEYAVLTALWDGGAMTARQLHEHVGVPSDLVSTTTTRVLDRLLDKSLITRRRRDGVFVYRAAVERATVDAARLSSTLSQMLLGEPGPALAALVDTVASVSPDLLEMLAALVKTRREPR